MRALVPLLATILLLSSPGAAAEAGIDAAVSIYPIAMLTEEIAGERATVTTIIPPGADPHHFELTPSGARSVHEADAVFMIGGDFDSWLIAEGVTAGSGEQRQIRVEFYESFADSLIALGETFNPHFWLDPLFAKKMGECIGLTLMAIDREAAEYYERNMLRFAAKMDSLHFLLKSRLRRSGFKEFVSFHPAWTYFARRYGLVEVGVVEQFPEYEASARRVAGLMDKMKRRQVQVIITEQGSDSRVVKGIAGDAGAEILVLDPLGDPGLPGRDTYFGLMEDNLRRIEECMSGRP